MSRYTRARRYLLRQYERAVDRIDEEDRAIFLGHRVEEPSYRQLVERHGVSVANVEQAMIRSWRVCPVGRWNEPQVVAIMAAVTPLRTCQSAAAPDRVAPAM